MDADHPTRIMAITQLTAQLNAGTPPRLHVQAAGDVRSAGWQQAQLRPLTTHGHAQTQTQTLLLEFVATPPDGMAAMVICPVSAALDLPLPAGVARIEVVAQTNRMTLELASLPRS